MHLGLIPIPMEEIIIDRKKGNLTLIGCLKEKGHSFCIVIEQMDCLFVFLPEAPVPVLGHRGEYPPFSSTLARSEWFLNLLRGTDYD